MRITAQAIVHTAMKQIIRSFVIDYNFMHIDDMQISFIIMLTLR